jgi:hypothetical protein
MDEEEGYENMKFDVISLRRKLKFHPLIYIIDNSFYFLNLTQTVNI